MFTLLKMGRVAVAAGVLTILAYPVTGQPISSGDDIIVTGPASAERRW